MQVSGTAFGDLTNAPNHRKHASAPVLHQLAGALGKGRTLSARPQVQAYGAEALADQVGLATVNSPDTITPQQMADAQRQSRRLHRKRVAKIVVDQWKWFTNEKLKMYPAIRHHNRRLLLSSLLALQRHSAHRQLEWRRAAIFNHRRQYLTQGRCLLLWHAQLDYSKRVQHQLETARQVRHRRQKHACFKLLWGYKVHKADCRKQHLQANFYRSFVLLTSAVQQWRGAAKASSEKKVKVNRALSFWADKQYSKAFESWQLGKQLQQHLRQMKGRADALYKCSVCLSVVQHWQAAVADLQDARQAASDALQVLPQTFWLKAAVCCCTYLAWASEPSLNASSMREVNQHTSFTCSAKSCNAVSIHHHHSMLTSKTPGIWLVAYRSFQIVLCRAVFNNHRMMAQHETATYGSDRRSSAVQVFHERLQAARLKELLHEWGVVSTALADWQRLKLHAYSTARQRLLRQMLTWYTTRACI